VVGGGAESSQAQPDRYVQAVASPADAVTRCLVAAFVNSFVLFTECARQHAMHAEGHIVLPILFVLPKRMDISSHFLTLW